MEKTMLILFVFIIALPNAHHAQDRTALRAARMSFNSAEKKHKAGNYREASQEYINNHIQHCEAYKRLDQDAEDFKKHFDKQLQ